MKRPPYITQNYRTLLTTLGLCLGCLCCFAQKEKTVVAGPQYKSSSFHQWLWGKHYRTEWTTPVRIPQLMLDTAFGGLKPYQEGGGRQTRTLRLQTADKKEYAMRSIDKSFGRAMPEIYRGTFLEKIINDQVSIGHPYSSLTIAPMAEAARIYHTNPIIRFVPKQPALDTFNESYGDQLYMIEQRPDENWEEAPNLGNAKNIISTENLLEKLLKDNSNLADQHMYVRARLFDMFVGDWGRHEDQWRWAEIKNNGKTYYQAIPRDRDQVYAKLEGRLLRLALATAGLTHLQSFQSKIKDVNHFNFPARYLDRRIANEAGMQIWIDNAKDIEKAMTDEVIESAIKQFPPEIYAISGEEIIAKLKSRRQELVDNAMAYYRFLAKEVDIPGTEKNEYFEIVYLDEKQARVSVYALDENGIKAAAPHYIRTFTKDETLEIRTYGIGGNDKFNISGNPNNPILVRVIGSKNKDIITDASGNKHVHVYDDKNNIFTLTNASHKHISNDDAIHEYNYEGIKYNRSSIGPTFFYSNYDRFYVGINHKLTKHGWRKDPFAYQHVAWIRHSFTQKAPSAGYIGMLTDVLGKWDLIMNGEYDGERWLNFFGIGNETAQLTDDRNFYRMRYREIYVGVGLGQTFRHSNIAFTPFYRGVRVLRDDDRYIAKSSHDQPSQIFTRYQFAGMRFNYNVSTVDNPIVPGKGVELATSIAHTFNLKEKGQDFTRYSANFNFYVPFSHHLVFVSRTGGATITGEPKFFQLNYIGGSDNLRGYRRERFWGHSTAFASNELQYRFNVKSSVFNGKAAVFGLYDVGRVWESGEQSNTWHTGYGGGVMLAPFNRIMVSVSYGMSKESKLFHLRLSKTL